MLPPAVAGMLPRRQAIARASVSALVASLPLLYISLLRPPPAALAGDTAFWFLMSNCVIAAIVATSGDAASTLLFRSAPDDDLYCAPAGQPPVPAHGIITSTDGAVVPLATSSRDETPAEDVDVDVNGGRVQGEVASAVTSSYSVHHALPSLIESQEEEDKAIEPSVEANHPFQRGEEKEVIIEPSTVKNNTVEIMEAQEEEDGDEVIIPLATIEEGSALADTEPEPRPRVLTSTKSVPEEGAAAAREEGLRRSATVGSTPAAEEESEFYWQLSDEELNRRVEDFIARFNREMRLQIEQEAGV